MTPSVLAAALGVGVVALLVARATLMPDVGRWDTAEAQTVPPLLGTMHPTGYPAYVLLGWLASVVLGPLGSVAFVMNLLSAVLLGVAAGATVVLGRLLTGWTALGVAAGLGATLTPVVWRIGVRADVHALHLATIAVLLVALVGWERARSARPAGHRAPSGRPTHGVEPADAADRTDPSQPTDPADRWLIAAAIVLGIALANHRLTVLLLPGIVAFVWLVEPGILRRRRFLAVLAATCLGVAAALYLLLPVRAGLFPAPLVYDRPDTPLGFLQVVLGTQFGGEVVGPLDDLDGKVRVLAARTATELGPLALLVPVGLAVTLLRRTAYGVLTGSAVLLTWLFAASYENADILRYYAVPGLVAWTWLAVGVGAALDVLVGAWRRRSSHAADHGPANLATADPGQASRGKALVATGLSLMAATLLLAPIVATLPTRWSAADASGDTMGRRWLEAALAALPQDAVVLSWWSYSTPLWYAQHIEGRRPDLSVIDDRTRIDEDLGDLVDVIESNLGRRPVYLIRYEASELAMLTSRYRLSFVELPAGQGLLEIEGRRTTP